MLVDKEPAKRRGHQHASGSLADDQPWACHYPDDKIGHLAHANKKMADSINDDSAHPMYPDLLQSRQPHFSQSLLVLPSRQQFLH
jgi:hypothetical protein